jgi:hypothetical protein
MQKKYVVRLSDEEREELGCVVKKLRGTSQKVRRAQILLKADADGPAWTDRQIAEAYGCRTKTVENVRQHLVERGFEQTLNGMGRKNPPRPKLLDGRQEAQVIAMRLSSPPPGYANWSLRLLARRIVELSIAESISHETVRRTLKKKRHDQPEDRVLGDPAPGRRPVRRGHGRSAGNLRHALRSGVSRLVYG